MTETIDDEWMTYLSMQNNNGNMYKHTKKINTTQKVHKEYVDVVDMDIDVVDIDVVDVDNLKSNEKILPFVDKMELIISTKTKVLFLNRAIDIHSIFWNIPVIDYWNPMNGVIKKQIKVVSKTPEEYENYCSKLVGIRYYQENIIKQIDNPDARSIKFKDERKITVGLSRKDIITYRSKVKNAFYNCFALVIRFKYNEEVLNLDGVLTEISVFKEIHVKVFNTGKMEIPGIVNSRILDFVKEMIMNIIQPHVETKLEFLENSCEDHVLINSNFNSGYFINREKIHSILNGKYGIESAYDPCSYPGVKCKFYFNNHNAFHTSPGSIIQCGRILHEDRSMKLSDLISSKKYTEVSFMIFRTGSCLVVGNCTERILRFVFEFIKQI
jgi:Fe-S-cluster formation regulator IscX/YfhJ